MTEVIAFTALCVSFLLFVVHYRNQVERRHGEIAHLRAEFLMKFSIIQQRITSNILYAETARIELRRIVNSNEKFESIEKIPNIIHDLKDISKGVKDLISVIEAIDSKKQNRSNVLLNLQSVSHDVKILEDKVSASEKNMISILEHIRSM